MPDASVSSGVGTVPVGVGGTNPNRDQARPTLQRLLQIFMPFIIMHFIGLRNFQEPTENIDIEEQYPPDPELAKEWDFLIEETSGASDAPEGRASAGLPNHPAADRIKVQLIKYLEPNYVEYVTGSKSKGAKEPHGAESKDRKEVSRGIRHAGQEQFPTPESVPSSDVILTRAPDNPADPEEFPELLHLHRKLGPRSEIRTETPGDVDQVRFRTPEDSGDEITSISQRHRNLVHERTPEE